MVRIFVQIFDHLLHIDPLRIFGVTEGIRLNWEFMLLSERDDMLFTHIGHGPNHLVISVIGLEAWRHGLNLTRKENIHHQGLDNIVPVMTQCDLITIMTLGSLIENSPPETRAK